MVPAPGSIYPWVNSGGRQLLMQSDVRSPLLLGADVVLSFIYPEICQVCREHRATPAEGYVCLRCWKNLRFIRAPFCDRCGLPYEGEITGTFCCSNCHDLELNFSRARSAVAAEGMALEIIHRWKYRRELWFEAFLAALLIQEAQLSLSEGWDCIVPIPLHSLKEREREFNQSLNLAQRLAAATSMPVCAQAVRRVEATRVQARLSREERRENVRKAFARGESGMIKGRRVVLVDDVLTTGATASACAGILRACGATEVCVWTVARGLIH
jgi:competence protein ComFC